MAGSNKKKDNFWDNPFGGIFDFDGNGKEDGWEQWIAYKIFQECTKEDNTTRSRNSSYTDSFIYSKPKHKPTWRDRCEDGRKYGLNPKDYEEEYEYEDALEEAKYAWRDTCIDGEEYDVDPYDYETEEEYLDAIEEAKYEWRDECDEGEEYDIYPEDYETEDEYYAALEEAIEEWDEEEDALDDE